MKRIDICLISDSNYTQYMATAMISILKNSNDDEIFTFHIIDGGILQTDKNKLTSLKDIKDFNIKFYTVNDNIIKKYQQIRKEKSREDYHITSAVYYVLELHNILKDLDKILYLDCDIIVNRSLYELYNTDINNYSIAVADRPKREEYANIHFDRIKLKDFDIFILFSISNKNIIKSQFFKNIFIRFNNSYGSSIRIIQNIIAFSFYIIIYMIFCMI